MLWEGGGENRSQFLQSFLIVGYFLVPAVVANYKWKTTGAAANT